jgi:hypothetical protein
LIVDVQNSTDREVYRSVAAVWIDFSAKYGFNPRNWPRLALIPNVAEAKIDLKFQLDIPRNINIECIK